MKISYYKLFRKLIPEARKIYYDKGRFQKVLTESMKTVDKKEIFHSLRHEMGIIFLLCTDVLRGHYRGIKKKNMILIIAALLYLLNPMDIVPDFILALGFLDDLTLLTFVLSKVKKELEEYENWRKSPHA